MDQEGARFMSDSRKTRRLMRDKRRSAAGEGEPGEAAEGPEIMAPAPPSFAVVASGENVVMIHTGTGQTWAMASDGRGPVWHPVEFSSPAPRAPRPPRRNRPGDATAADEKAASADDAAD
jgi:hypothetical protein